MHRPGLGNIKFSLIGALAAISVVSSGLVFMLGFFGVKPLLTEYVRGVVRGQQTTIESFFTENVSQQILTGDGAEVLRKCHLLLRENYVSAVSIRDLSGKMVCDLQKPSDDSPLRWSKSPVYFDEEGQRVATDVWLAFSTKSESNLIWIALLAAIAGAVLLLLVQILVTMPLARLILKPLADISAAVSAKNPEEIQLPTISRRAPLVTEVSAIFLSMQGFLERFQLYKSQLIESTRFEAVARTVQIIAHDLKAPMASFERLTRIPPEQFAQEKQQLIRALQQLYSMTNAIKRAEFEDVVRVKADTLRLDSLRINCQSIAEKLGKTLHFQGPETIADCQIDADKLQRALGNLIINALEACHNKVLVIVRPHRGVVEFLIEDDGPGVPVDLQARLFVRGATHGKTQGTGLGLHYAQHVAQGHGGDVVYERDQGVTRFICTIPCGEPDPIDVVPDEPRLVDRDILFIAATQEKLAVLQSLDDFVGVDLCLGADSAQLQDRSYRFILSEDWDVTASMKARQQKILVDPNDPVTKAQLMIQRLRRMMHA